MRAVAFSVCLVAVLAFMGFLFHGCNAAMDADTESHNKVERDWLAFSMQHHCRVSRPSSFSDPNVTWQCDGFEVRR